jgi:hypothetical protein
MALNRGRLYLFLCVILLWVDFCASASHHLIRGEITATNNAICSQLFHSYVPHREYIGSMPINYLNETERSILRSFTAESFRIGAANISIGLSKGHLIKLGQGDRIPGREGLLDREETVLQKFLERGGEIYLWLDHSPRQSVSFSLTADGRPIIMLVEKASPRRLAHEINHYEHILDVQDFLRESRLQEVDAFFEPLNLTRSILGTRIGESRAIAAEARTEINLRDQVPLLEGSPANFVIWNSYPEISQLVFTLWTRDQVSRFPWFLTQERRQQRRELLALLAPLTNSLVKDIVSTALNSRETIKRELLRSLPRQQKTSVEIAKAKFIKMNLEALEIPLTDLIMHDPNQTAYKSYGQEIYELIQREIAHQRLERK